MASIQRIKGRKRWRVRWREGGRGTPEHASPWVESKAEAEAELRAIEARLAADKTIKQRAGIPLDDLVGKWAKHQRERTRPRSERYIEEGQRTLLALIKAKGWARTSDVGHADDLPINTFRLLRALLRFGRDRHDQPVSVRSLVAPDTKRRKEGGRTLISDERAAELVSAAADWSDGNGAIADLVATYGHRPESLVHLTVGSVALLAYMPLPKRGKPPQQIAWLTLRVKSGDIHRHPLLASSAAKLAKAAAGRADREPLFVNHLGEPWSSGQAFSAWFHHCVGKGTGIYRLKDRAITRLLAAGVDLATIASMTGHRDPVVLMRYAHTNEAKQAAALDALEKFGVDDVCTPKSHKSGKRS